jgi:hypothetical protein
MNHVIGILFNPAEEWGKIRDRNDTALGHYIRFLILIACLPPFAWFYGSTEVGWTLGHRVIKLTPESAMQIMILFYISTLAGIAVLGYMVHWMSETYGVEGSTFSKGVGIAAYTCTPMFIIGAIGFYPVLWLDISLGMLAAGYAVYLLYIGVPVVMEVPRERGFLFASAMVAVGLVMCAALMAATVILWGIGAMPVFTD